MFDTYIYHMKCMQKNVVSKLEQKSICSDFDVKFFSSKKNWDKKFVKKKLVIFLCYGVCATPAGCSAPRARTLLDLIPLANWLSG